MKKDGLSSRGHAVHLPGTRRAEMLAQINREIRHIKLIAGNDKGNALTNEARPVVRADGHCGEHHCRMGDLADYVDMLSDVGGSSFSVDFGNNYALTSKDVSFVKCVGAPDKGRKAARGFKWADIYTRMKKLSQIAFQRF